MSPFALSLLRFAFLGLLYVFIWMAVRQVVAGVAGRGGARRIEPARPRPTAAAPGTAAAVVVREPGRPERELRLVGPIEIGRDADLDVPLADAFASHRHARIARGPSGWTVEDLGSRNGTLLNDRRIDGPTTLRPGDTVRVGETVLEVRA